MRKKLISGAEGVERKRKRRAPEKKTDSREDEKEKNHMAAVRLTVLR